MKKTAIVEIMKKADVKDLKLLHLIYVPLPKLADTAKVEFDKPLGIQIPVEIWKIPSDYER